jgi:hypothetical protein
VPGRGELNERERRSSDEGLLEDHSERLKKSECIGNDCVDERLTSPGCRNVPRSHCGLLSLVDESLISGGARSRDIYSLSGT